jgi:rod shape-determining protein MreC
MHSVQDAAATVMQPFQVGADRLVAPFRDAWGYVSDLRTAKSEADKYRKQLETLRAQSFQYADAIHRNRELEALLAYRSSPRFPDDYTSVTAQVISEPINRFQQRIVIAAGHDQGIRRDYPVVVRAGLVGHVTRVTSDTAQVTLITDQQSTVSAQDAETRARGGIRGQGAGKWLLLDRVPKEKEVREGDRVVTSGRRYLELPSLYPANIGVGTVESVTQRDIENFATIVVKPFVEVSDLDSVLVLIPKAAASGLPSDDGR